MSDNTPYSHDKSYKRLFSSPELVQQLVEGFVDPAIARLLDFSTLEKVEGSYVTPSMKNRENDIVWKVQAGNTTVYLYLLLEFQSTVDHAMPVRMIEGAAQTFAADSATGSLPTAVSDLVPTYIKTTPACPAGGMPGPP